MIGLGPTIGPTIFVVPRLTVEMCGPAAIFAFILACVFSLFTALNYAEMSSYISKAGGGYSFVSYTFGGAVAFLSGWFMYVGSVAYAALSAYTSALALSSYIPLPAPYCAFIILLLFTIINLLGIKRAGSTQVTLTVFVVLVLLAFLLLGSLRVDANRYEPFTPFGVSPIFMSLGYVFSIYIGFELITNVSEEVKRAQRVVPRAIIATILIALLLFPLLIAVLIGAVDYNDIASSQTPLISSSFMLFGPFGLLMSGAAILASLASLNASVIAASRTLFALSRDGHIPGVFESINRSFRTPHFTLLLGLVLALTLLFLASVELIVYISDLAYLLGLTIINPCGVLIRRRVGTRGLRLPLYPLIPIIASITIVLILPTISYEAMLVGFFLTLIGLVMVLVERAVKRLRMEGAEGA